MTFDPKLFEEIERDLDSLTIDEIRERLRPLLRDFVIQTPIFDPGTFIYRARRFDSNFSKRDAITRSQLVYPPAAVARLGRLNREAQPIFYAGMAKEAIFFEIPDLAAGDDILVSYWKTTERMLVNNIGYTEFAFEQLGAKRPVPVWPGSRPADEAETMPLSTREEQAASRFMADDASSDLKIEFSKHFAKPVGLGETQRYKLTAAIGELHLGNVENHSLQFAGILYPSVRMWANGDNVALQPWFVDQHLEFRKAVHIRIKERGTNSFEVDNLDAAHRFDENGNLVWLGRLKNWTLKPGQSATITLQSGIDEDGDYSISKDGTPCHWVATDLSNGRVIEAT